MTAVLLTALGLYSLSSTFLLVIALGGNAHLVKANRQLHKALDRANGVTP